MKAYILRINDPISIQYAKDAADSCDRIGLKWEYFDGYMGDARQAWISTGIEIANFDNFRANNAKAQCCTAGHAHIWKKIAEGNEPAIVLEHDAIMLHYPKIQIPDDTLVVLGYKVSNPTQYDHSTAGPPEKLVTVLGHEGAHAYALTPKTAQMYIDHLGKHGIKGAVDNIYFLKKRKIVPKNGSMITDPICALGWIRQSTIWGKSATRNYEPIGSFQQHWSGKKLC